MLCWCRDGHGYPCIDQGPSLGGFAKSADGTVEADLFSSEGDDEVELEKSNVLLLGPTGDSSICCSSGCHGLEVNRDEDTRCKSMVGSRQQIYLTKDPV